MLKFVFAELNEWATQQNQKLESESCLPLRKSSFRIVGQSALLEASSLSLTLTATMDVDAFADCEPSVRTHLEELLQKRGRVLDPVGHEAWMPDETEYEVFYFGNLVVAEIAGPEYVLVSKALKAPEKNRNLIIEYLAQGPSDLFYALAEEYGVDLEKFVA